MSNETDSTPDQTNVSVEVPGHAWRAIGGNAIPPVGTQFMVHKHLTDGGTYLKLEVTKHVWALEEPNHEDGLAYFSVRVHTKVIS